MQVGDLVQLKHGDSPRMTVTYCAATIVYTTWFNQGRQERGEFPPGALRAASLDLPAMQTQHGTAALDPLWAAHVSF